MKVERPVSYTRKSETRATDIHRICADSSIDCSWDLALHCVVRHVAEAHGREPCFGDCMGLSMSDSNQSQAMDSRVVGHGQDRPSWCAELLPLVPSFVPYIWCSVNRENACGESNCGSPSPCVDVVLPNRSLHSAQGEGIHRAGPLLQLRI